MGIEDSRDKTTERLKLAAQAALEGNSAMAEQHLEAAGQIARDAAKAVIGDGDRLEPLSEKDAQATSCCWFERIKPLYAHGFLLLDQYVVRKK
jgi:hypothetical protein